VMCRTERYGKELRWRRRTRTSRGAPGPFYREWQGCFRLLLAGDGRDPAAVWVRFPARIVKLQLASDVGELVHWFQLVSDVREVEDSGRDVASAVALSTRDEMQRGRRRPPSRNGKRMNRYPEAGLGGLLLGCVSPSCRFYFF
jgi:hypothetical protein